MTKEKKQQIEHMLIGLSEEDLREVLVLVLEFLESPF